ncbi:MAG: ABC1 kinase family protein, partial [Ilumatobacteraceae bacterium]
MEDELIVDISWWGMLFYGVPFIIVVGWFGGRILGVRRGWVRALVSGFIGWLAGLIITAVVLNEDITTDQLWDVLIPTFLFGLLVSMFVSLILDVILKPRRHRRRRWGPILHPIATIKRRLSPLGRSREIIGYARKRGLTGLRSATPSRLATPDAARRLRLMLEDCGGMFVKFGQIASTRTDLLPEVLTSELSHLQSSARPVPGDEIRAVVERELGASLDEEFASFDFEPLAAASIGQTHRAVLRSGENVVVKIQRPGIEAIVQRDAAVLRIVANQVERRVDAARVLGVRRLADELITSLEKELDYGAEARNGTAFVENLDVEKGVTAPTVVQSLSTRRVLVMQAIDGVTVADRDAVEATPVAKNQLAIRLMRSFLDQVLRDGVYHADPHPGNIFVDPQGVLWLLDFGAVGRLDPLI